jgi:hypothetical protein
MKDNVIPFSTPVKKLKDDFKKQIDEMDDDEFLSMMVYLMADDIDAEEFTKDEIDNIRKHYMENVPEGFTKEQIKKMKDDEILDMDYFLNE